MKYILFLTKLLVVSSYLRKKEYYEICTQDCIKKENLEPHIYFNISYDCYNNECKTLFNNFIIINNTKYHIDNCFQKYDHVNCIITNNNI